MLCICGFTCCPRASYLMCWWGWLALIIPATSLMILETVQWLHILRSTSEAPAQQKGEGGCFEWIDASVHRRDISNSSTTSWEEYILTQRNHCDKHSTANSRAAGNILGQPRQSRLHIPDKSEAVYRMTHRCVSLPLLYVGFFMVMFLIISRSGENLQWQKIKCLGPHEIVCIISRKCV